jgi:queuine/archaeosine tRNA-ribosyltransferase
MLSNIYGIKNGKKENMLNENLKEYKIKWIFHNQLFLKNDSNLQKNKHVNKLHKFINFF